MKKITYFFGSMVVAVMATFVASQVSAFSVLVNIESDAIAMIQREVSGYVDAIIEEELLRDVKKKARPSDVPQLKLIQDPHITLLYDRVMPERFHEASNLALQVMQALGRGVLAPQELLLTNEPDLFGFHEEFLVLKVRDAQGSLGALRNEVLSSLRWLNAYYQDDKGTSSEEGGWGRYIIRFIAWVRNLFGFSDAPKKAITDMASWDRFSFNPHISLGKLPQKEIFKRATWYHKDGKKVWETIKERIRKEVFPLLVANVATEPLLVNGFNVYGKKYQLLRSFVCHTGAEQAQPQAV